MAGLYGVAQTAEVALAAAGIKTVLQIVAPANHRVKIRGWGVFFDGVSVTGEPVQVQLRLQTTAGTMTALTPVKTKPAAETLLVTALSNATAEPTASDVLDIAEVHPQSSYEVQYGIGGEIELQGGGRIGIECTAPAAVNVRAKIHFEE